MTEADVHMLAAARVGLLCDVYSALNDAGVRWCLLAHVPGMPRDVTSDADLMVAPSDEAATQSAILGVGDSVCVQIRNYEATARTYIVWRDTPGSTGAFVAVDVATDLRGQGAIFAPADYFLSTRSPQSDGSWACGAGPAFGGYVVRRLLKVRWLGDAALTDAATNMVSMWQADSAAALEAVSTFLPRGFEPIANAIGTGRWNDIDATSLHRRLLHGNGGLTRWRKSLQYYVGEGMLRARRLVRREGFVVAVLGPDGVGKSTVIERVGQAVGMGYSSIRVRHLRPYFAGTGNSAQMATAPHEVSARDPFTSNLKLVYWVLDYALGWCFQIVPDQARGVLTIFDRYFYDIIADSRRHRFGGSSWLAQVAARLVPRPDVLLVLDAPASVVVGRKNEISLAAAEELRSAYADVALAYSGTVIDADQDVESVVLACEASILAAMASRVRHRTEQSRG